MKAIILAAGLGSRLRPLTRNKPKCLLPISANESILGRQLRILKHFRIDTIIVIVGYKAETIMRRHGRAVRIVFNPQYAKTGDAFSLWMAKDELNDDVLILNGDVVFTEAAINSMLNEKNSLSVLVERKKCKPDDLKVEVKDGLVVNFSKSIPLKKAFGEAIGIGKIKREKIDTYQEMLCESIKRNPQIRWLEVFNHLIYKGEGMHFVLTTEPCCENDTVEDYRNTREILAKLK